MCTILKCDWEGAAKKKEAIVQNRSSWIEYKLNDIQSGKMKFLKDEEYAEYLEGSHRAIENARAR